MEREEGVEAPGSLWGGPQTWESPGGSASRPKATLGCDHDPGLQPQQRAERHAAGVPTHTGPAPVSQRQTSCGRGGPHARGPAARDRWAGEDTGTVAGVTGAAAHSGGPCPWPPQPRRAPVSTSWAAGGPGPHGLHPETPLTHPPRLRSQLASVLCTNSPRQSTRAGTTAGWACRTQSTASPAATEYRDTTLPHVTPAERDGGAAQQKAAETPARAQPTGPTQGLSLSEPPPAMALAARVRLGVPAPLTAERGARPTSTTGQSCPCSQWFLGRHFLGLHYTPAHLCTCSPAPEPGPALPSPSAGGDHRTAGWFSDGEPEGLG